MLGATPFPNLVGSVDASRRILKLRSLTTSPCSTFILRLNNYSFQCQYLILQLVCTASSMVSLLIFRPPINQCSLRMRNFGLWINFDWPTLGKERLVNFHRLASKFIVLSYCFVWFVDFCLCLLTRSFNQHFLNSDYCFICTEGVALVLLSKNGGGKRSTSREN